MVTEPVPNEDRALLERLAGDDTPAGEPRHLHSVDPLDLRRFDTAREIAVDARRARVTLPRGVPALRAGETRGVEVEVTNLGDEWWPAADGPPPVRVSSRWRGRHDVRLADGPRAAFTEEVDPGGTTRVLMPVTGPIWPGRYRLDVGVLQEGVGWFRGEAEATIVIEPSSERAEVGAHAPGGTYRAVVEPLVERARLGVGERAAIPVRVRNEGSLEWDSSGRSRPPVTVSCRWIDSRGVVVVMDAPRTPLREPVPPGGEATVGLDVAAPVRPGSYTIEIDLVEESVRWFGAARPLAVDVRAPLRLGARRSWARRRAPVRRARLHREIPPILHRIWIGGAPLPAEFEAFGQTWRQHHPHWEFRTWGDHDAEALLPRRVLRGSRSPSELSNLVRYEILRRHGGVYVDTDVECRRPIDPLLAGASAFAGWERHSRLGTAVLASAPRHPVFELAAREARLTQGLGLDSVEANGPGFFTQVVAERPLIMAYPKEHFYPYLWDEPYRRHESFPQSFAVHHWQLSWKLSESS